VSSSIGVKFVMRLLLQATCLCGRRRSGGFVFVNLRLGCGLLLVKKLWTVFEPGCQDMLTKAVAAQQHHVAETEFKSHNASCRRRFNRFQ
jgi:hypothetical protein